MLKVISDILNNKKISDTQKCSEIKCKIDFYQQKQEQIYNSNLREIRKYYGI